MGQIQCYAAIAYSVTSTPIRQLALPDCAGIAVKSRREECCTAIAFVFEFRKSDVCGGKLRTHHQCTSTTSWVRGVREADRLI
nr:hypothetical protein [Nostoc sp. EkiNYC01]